ncbi:MAG: uroporphyrinogen-III synthase [Wenzhouxiangellaceae bacterium]
MKQDPVVVVTRPAPDHVELQRQLAAAGRKALHCPAFRLQDLPSRQLERVHESLKQCDIVLVTSPAAARRLQHRSASRPRSSPVFICPGAGTAESLAEIGIHARFPETGSTSEDLLAMPELYRVAGKLIVILAAPGGRTLVLETLRKRGARVRRHFLYRRVSCAPDPAVEGALRAGRPLIFMFSSSAALEALVDRLDARLRNRMLDSAFVVSSARLAIRCRELGATAVSIADGASDQAMLAALE